MKEPETLSPLQIAFYAINCTNEDHYADEIAKMITDYASEVARDNIRELNETKKLLKMNHEYFHSKVQEAMNLAIENMTYDWQSVQDREYTEQEILEKLKL